MKKKKLCTREKRIYKQRNGITRMESLEVNPQAHNI